MILERGPLVTVSGGCSLAGARGLLIAVASFVVLRPLSPLWTREQ